LLPHLKNASIGSLKVEFIEKKLTEVKGKEKADYKNVTSAIGALLVEKEPLIKGNIVLWYDDSPSNNTAIRLLLEEAGLKFEVVVSYQRLVKLLGTKRYAAVISDSCRQSSCPEREDLTVVKEFEALRVEQAGRLPPWFFYSASLGRRPVPGAALSTSNPYDLIKVLVNTIADSNNGVAAQSKSRDYTVSIWFFVACIVLLLVFMVSFVLVIIYSSSAKSSQNDEPQEADVSPKP
jgi:CheY-like chemotaxis protein